MSNNSELVLGIDGGGTKTVACLGRLADANESVLGTGVAGPGNPRAIGFPQAQSNIDAAIESAFADAQLPRTTVRAACFALAGAGRALEQQQMAAWASERHIARSVRVTTDAEPVLAAASAENCGVALICGTGSLAWGRNHAGGVARCGGWGRLLGDEGSAYWMSLAGLQAAARAADKRDRPTALLERYLERLDAAGPPDLIDRMHDPDMTPDRIASMVDIVFGLAASDEVAARIVEAGALSLADCIANVARRLEFKPAAYPLAFAGSTVLKQDCYRQLILSHLARMDLSPATVVPVSEPARGAVAIARACASSF